MDLSSDTILGIFFTNNGTTYFHSGSSGTPFIFRNFAQGDIFSITNGGDISATGILTVNGAANIQGNMNIGTTGQPYKLYVNGTSFLNNNVTVSGNMTVTNGSLYLPSDIWMYSSDMKQRMYFGYKGTTYY